MQLAPRNESEAFLCQDADHIHSRAVRCTRRIFLGGLVSLGAGALFPDQSASAEAAVDKPFRIDVHHHLSSPGFIAEISGRRTGQMPLMKWTWRNRWTIWIKVMWQLFRSLLRLELRMES